MSVARYSRIDDAGVLRFDLIRSQAPALHGAGPEILDYDIGFGEQIKCQFAALIGLEVEGHTFFIAGEGVVPERHAVADLSPLSNGVPCWWLDFNDLCTKIAQNRAGERAGQ